MRRRHRAEGQDRDACPAAPAGRRAGDGSGGRFRTAATMFSALTRQAETATTASVSTTPSA